MSSAQSKSNKFTKEENLPTDVEFKRVSKKELKQLQEEMY